MCCASTARRVWGCSGHMWFDMQRAENPQVGILHSFGSRISGLSPAGTSIQSRAVFPSCPDSAVRRCLDALLPGIGKFT